LHFGVENTGCYKLFYSLSNSKFSKKDVNKLWQQKKVVRQRALAAAQKKRHPAKQHLAAKKNH
jgi:hypothetical protein